MADLVEVTPVVYGLTESDTTDNIEEEERLKQTIKVSTILFTLFFKIMVLRAGIHKMDVRIANRDTMIRLILGLRCLSRPFLPGN